MASAQSAPSSPTLGRTQRESMVTEPPKFDLESYIQNYQGRTRLERLIHIGSHSTFLGADALKLAVREAKAGKDIRRYLEAQSHLETIAPLEPEAVADRAWVELVDKQNKAEAKRMEAELKGYKNNLVKESIRMGNEDLGRHYQAIGDLSRAFDAFGRMRQDISAPKQIIDVSKHLIEVAVEQRNWIAVSSNLQKIKGLAPSNSPSADPWMQPYLVATEGLAQFDAGMYRNAAVNFLQTESGMGSTCATIMSPNDVAVYGGLCALATMDRNELQSKVLDNSHFRTYLELEPHIRKAIAAFVNSRYTLCLEILEGYRTDYLLDIYLQRHVTALYQMVRSKCIVQYFIPFSCVTLDSLNEAFASPGATVDKELAVMIQAGELNARINTVDRLLEVVPSNRRAESQQEALKMAREYERDARRRILRMNIGLADLEVKGAKRGGQLSSAADDFLDAHAHVHASGVVHRS